MGAEWEVGELAEYSVESRDAPSETLSPAGLAVTCLLKMGTNEKRLVGVASASKLTRAC
jgi:hypothetical protein